MIRDISLFLIRGSVYCPFNAIRKFYVEIVGNRSTRELPAPVGRVSNDMFYR